MTDCVTSFQSCEKVRLCLEQCQVENEILEFLDSSATGGTRPGIYTLVNPMDFTIMVHVCRIKSGWYFVYIEVILIRLPL